MMHFYRKKMFWVSIFLLFFMFLGLTIVACNMSKITLHDTHDFLFGVAKGKERWELRFLGLSWEINRELIREQWWQIAEYVSRGRTSLEKARVYLQEQFRQGKNRQGGGHPIK